MAAMDRLVYTRQLETDYDYRVMLASTLREILIDLITGDTRHIKAIAEMALIVNNDGPDSARAINHLLECGYFASDMREVN